MPYDLVIDENNNMILGNGFQKEEMARLEELSLGKCTTIWSDKTATSHGFSTRVRNHLLTNKFGEINRGKSRENSNRRFATSFFI